LAIAVIGRNRETSVEAGTTTFVYIPMYVESFTVSSQPDPLVRYVIGTLSLDWNVPGAVFVQIRGLSDFTKQLLQSSTSYEAVDTLEGISGIPIDPITITLYAEDEAGNPLEETRQVALIDPLCTSLTEIPLHEGPNERYQQVGNVPQNTQVVVMAQDGAAGWLRIQMAGDVRGWGPRDDFECPANFNLSDLRTEVDLPELPTENPLPSATSVPDQQSASTPAPAATLTPTSGG
jgi:hypothetical protein